MALLDRAFPDAIALPECVRELLRAIYPVVRWDVVSFHAGLPAVIRGFTNVAVTLPDPLSLRHVRISVTPKEWKKGTGSVELLGTLVHECYHVVQYQQRIRGWGLGPLRPFVAQYLAASVIHGGGVANRFEAPAYEHERLFISAYKQLPVKPCDPGVEGVDRSAAISDLLRRASALVVRKAKPWR